MASKDLFYLIKSLSSHEKGYIKKHSIVHVIGEQNKYIKIFDAIDRQREYQEEPLHLIFDKDPIENLQAAKHYLFKFILKCLESYHVNTKTELRSMLNQIEILYNKNLPGMARKMIAKAKITARQYELYEFMEEIIDWEIVFLVEEATPEDYVELVNKYFGELNDSIEKKKTIINYKYLYQVLRAKALYKGLPRNDEDVLEVKKIASRAKKNDQWLLSTFNARFYRNLMRSNYMFMTNEQKQANELMEENVKMLEDNPHMIDLRPGSYLGMLRNKAVNELALMRYKTLFDTMNKMENFVIKYGHLNHSFEITVANLKLFVLIPSGQFQDALEVAQRLDLLYMLLPPTKSLEKEKHLQLYAFGYIYIGLGDYKEANAHINALLNASRVDVRSDLYCFANIMSLIINFEMGNQELLQNRIRSTYKLLQRRKQLHNFEKAIIDFLRETKDYTKGMPEMRQAFIDLKKNIDKITSENKLEKNALSMFDLLSWLESKIERKSFMQIKQKKFMKIMSSEAHNAHVH